MADYYCTSEAWPVKKSAEQVLIAINSWLHALTKQSQNRYDPDAGYLCAFSAVVIKSTTAHVLHAGNSLVHLLRGNTLGQLTRHHRHRLAHEHGHLNRALGIRQNLEIDYHALQVNKGDIFLLVTDGIHEYLVRDLLVGLIHENEHDLNKAAKEIVDQAHAYGSTDNLTAQLVRVDELPGQEADTL